MSKIVSKSEKEIKEAIIKALNAAIDKQDLPKSDIPDFKIEIPADRANGDYASNAAMVSARAFRMAPAKIARIINFIPIFLRTSQIRAKTTDVQTLARAKRSMWSLFRQIPPGPCTSATQGAELSETASQAYLMPPGMRFAVSFI